MSANEKRIASNDAPSSEGLPSSHDYAHDTTGDGRTRETEGKVWNDEIHALRKTAEQRFSGPANLREVYLAALRSGERNRVMSEGLYASWRMSVRTIAEWSNVSKATASRRLRELVELGFLVRVYRGNDETAAIWALGPTSLERFKDETVLPKALSSTVSVLKNHWPDGLLDNNAKLVWQTLMDEGQLISVLAKRTGLAYNTVYRCLADLRRFGLADVNAKTGWLRGIATLAEAAENAGAAQIARERKECHARDRDGWIEEKSERWNRKQVAESREKQEPHLIAGDYGAQLDGELMWLEGCDDDIIDAPLWWGDLHELAEAKTCEQSERDLTRSFVLSKATCPHCGGNYEESTPRRTGVLAWRCKVCSAELCILFERGLLVIAEAGRLPDGQVAFLGDKYTQSVWEQRQAVNLHGSRNERWRIACGDLTAAWGKTVFRKRKLVEVALRPEYAGA
jgi:DNA-binding transcriptional regulator YhcF (GntR family)